MLDWGAAVVIATVINLLLARVNCVGERVWLKVRCHLTVVSDGTARSPLVYVFGGSCHLSCHGAVALPGWLGRGHHVCGLVVAGLYWSFDRLRGSLSQVALQLVILWLLKHWL